jgi:hypothetical protein
VCVSDGGFFSKEQQRDEKGFHIHGNGGDPFTNRIEYRSSHCERSPQSIDLEIVIDDRTVRKLKKTKPSVK